MIMNRSRDSSTRCLLAPNLPRKQAQLYFWPRGTYIYIYIYFPCRVSAARIANINYRLSTLKRIVLTQLRMSKYNYSCLPDVSKAACSCEGTVLSASPTFPVRTIALLRTFFSFVGISLAFDSTFLYMKNFDFNRSFGFASSSSNVYICYTVKYNLVINESPRKMRNMIEFL